MIGWTLLLLIAPPARTILVNNKLKIALVCSGIMLAQSALSFSAEHYIMSSVWFVVGSGFWFASWKKLYVEG